MSVRDAMQHFLCFCCLLFAADSTVFVNHKGDIADWYFRMAHTWIKHHLPYLIFNAFIGQWIQ